MSQFAQYPATGGGSSANASVGSNGAAIQTSSTLVAGKSPTSTQVPMSVDALGQLNVNVVSGGSSNPSIGIIGAATPTFATTVGAQNIGGNLVPLKVDASGNLLVSGGSGSNASVGLIGAPTPASGTFIAGKNGSGNLTGLSITSLGDIPAIGSVADGPSPGPTASSPLLQALTGFWLGSNYQYKNSSGSITTPSTLVCSTSSTVFSNADQQTSVGNMLVSVQRTIAGAGSLEVWLSDALGIMAVCTGYNVVDLDTGLIYNNIPVSASVSPSQRYSVNVHGALTIEIRTSSDFTGEIFAGSSTNKNHTEPMLAATEITQQSTIGLAGAIAALAGGTGLIGFDGTILRQVGVTTAGELKVSSSSSSALDYGSSASAARVASQIGNSTGAANFGAGAATAQTLRTVLANDSVQDLSVTGAAAQTALANNILTNPSGTAATDLIGYRSATVQVISTGTAGTFIFEGSNDNTNFVSVPVFNQIVPGSSIINSAITATVSNIIYTLPVAFRYLRLRIVTAITGGSIQAFSKFSQQTFTPAVLTVAQGTAANLQATVTPSGTLPTNVAQINAVTPLMGAGVTGTGSQRVTTASCATSVITSVAGSASSVSLLGSSATRRGATLFNESTAIAYVAFAVTSSVTAYTVQIPPGGYYELPGPNFYSGAISCIWAAANGNMRITDIS